MKSLGLPLAPRGCAVQE